MVQILIVMLALIICSGAAAADVLDSHQLSVDITLGLSSSASDFVPWTDGGFGKLRFEDGTDLGARRVLVEYRGRLMPTLLARVSVDYVDDASPGVGLTEAWLEWRPIPRSPIRQQWRLGAFYPPLSLENGERGWTSSYTPSFSAVNTWFGEEIRPIGIEWSLKRPIGPSGSPYEFGAFAAAFYGDDSAGTQLFWRGFAIHDRQSRFGDELPLVPAPIFDSSGSIVGYRKQSLKPFVEVDSRPGFYAGLEWRYSRRALVQLAVYDNRSDPEAFADGSWGWHTRFLQLGTQFDLSESVGLVAQWLSGETHWLIATTPEGLRTPGTELVHDEFDAAFVLLTKRLSDTNRLTLRFDDFRYSRAPDKVFDSGNAWTAGYRHDAGGRFALALEWLVIDSDRDLWADFYGAPRQMTERQLRLEMTVRLRP